MKNISLNEAVGVIAEWGVDCDNFVSCNYHQMLIGGEPTDNSVELAYYFFKCLRMVCDLGLKAYKQPNLTDNPTISRPSGKI